MSKYIRRPKSEPIVGEAAYETYNLSENPFPATPFINPESTDDRLNGRIYEPSIRQKEYQMLISNFLSVPQNDPNHLRLGYIMDTSYIGRGNGKSAFLVNVKRDVNRDFGLTVSNEANRCFAVIVVPEPGGKTKTFETFIDLFANSIFQSGIITDALTSLRLEAIIALHQDFDIDRYFSDDRTIKESINQLEWYTENNISFRDVSRQIMSSDYLQKLPPDFPLDISQPLIDKVSTEEDFIQYFKNLRRGKPKYNFIFSDLVGLFLAAGFNGAYVFVDDFERIPDFQSGRQKRDFAVELRTCLFDGLYTNAKIGFYNLILVLHAGVPSLIQEAWDLSGLEHRSPVSFKGSAKHVIRFEKITIEDTISLVKKYLDAYRITSDNEEKSGLFPFEDEALNRIAETSEYNASKILKMAHEVLDKAAKQSVMPITSNFILESEDSTSIEERKISGIHDAPTRNLLDESDR